MLAILDEISFVPARMDAEYKASWLDGLEGGTYPQGRGQLRVTDPETGRLCYCVFGVLCDVTPGITWKKVEKTDIIPEGSWAACAVDETPVVFELPVFILENAGLSDELVGHLVNANDEEVSFAKLARFIRTHL